MVALNSRKQEIWRWDGLFASTPMKAQTLHETLMSRRLEAEGLTVLGWRNPPINDQVAGDVARASQPAIRKSSSLRRT